MINASIEKELKKNLKEIFGFDNFRGEQEKIITSIVSGEKYICNNANRSREITLLSVACHRFGRNRYRNLTSDCPHEKSGRSADGIWYQRPVFEQYSQ